MRSLSFSAANGLINDNGYRGCASISPDGQRILVDNISGPFEIYAASSSSPSISLARPRDVAPDRNIVKQGVFAEDGKVAVCGSADGRLFVYTLGGREGRTSKIMPTQILDHGTRSAVQAVAVSSLPFLFGYVHTSLMCTLHQSFSFPERHLIVSGPTQEVADITIWGRERVIHDAPLEVEDGNTEEEEGEEEKEEPLPGTLPPSLSDIDPVGLLGLVIIIAAICFWHYGITAVSVFNIIAMAIADHWIEGRDQGH